MNATDRIKTVYRQRQQAGRNGLYSPFNKASLHLTQQREKQILKILEDAVGGEGELGGKRILDVGCGEGANLRDLVKYGAKPGNCHGIDLLPERIDRAKSISPNMNFVQGNAEQLPYDAASFDLVLLFTVLTSILEKDMKQNLAGEILRVLGPGGIIIYYDFLVDNRRNPDVAGVKREEIVDLFPDCRLRLKRTTLAPPISRSVAPVSTMFCQFMEKIPVLCSHYLGTIRKA